MDKKRILLVLNVIISLLLIAAILHVVGFSDVISSLSTLNIWYVALSMLFLLIMDLIMAFRVRLLLNHSGLEITYFEVLKSHIVGMLAADFTPARSGYLATAGVLHYKYGVNSEKAMVSILGPQIYDFALKLIVGTLAVIYILFSFMNATDGWIIILGSFFMLIMLSTMILLLFSRRFLSIFSFAERFPFISKIFNMFKKMQETSYVVIDKTPQLLVLMLCSWTVKSLSWYFAAKAVGITLGTEFPEVLFYFFLQPLLTMLEFMPSPTIAGLGLSEGGAALIYSFFGISGAAAATFALLVRFKTTFVHLPAVPEAIATLRRRKSTPESQK
jgi:uncharacterized protein (TIRG00374 family)